MIIDTALPVLLSLFMAFATLADDVVIRDPRLSDLALTGLSVIAVRDRGDDARFKIPGWEVEYGRMNPSLLQLRVFFSSDHDLARVESANLLFDVLACLGEVEPAVDHLERIIRGSNIVRPTTGYLPPDLLPEGLAARKDLKRHDYYTYVDVTRRNAAFDPGSPVYDLREAPPPLSIQLRFRRRWWPIWLVSNVITVPAADIARAWQDYLQRAPSRRDDK